MQAVDRVVITTVIEGYVDMLLGSCCGVTRPGMKHHFDPTTENPIAENGLSFFIELFSGEDKYNILFDVGHTPEVIKHNFRALGIDPTTINQVALSHGHPDHYGGIAGALEVIGHPVPVVIHPDAFNPRYMVMGNGGVIPCYNYDLLDQWKSLGACVVQATTPMLIGPGTMISGEVARNTSFEPPKAPKGKGGNLYCVKDGIWESDETLDDLALAINLKDKGLVIVTGCAHTGIINTIKHMQQITGIDKVHAVMGGFHLGFPGVPEENIKQTVEIIKQLNPTMVSPMHCSGFKTMAAFNAAMPEQFVINTVGTKIEL